MTKISIKIKNPSLINSCFGNESGDYQNDPVGYWVGTPDNLFPAAHPLPGSKIIHAPVRFGGGGAWVDHGTRDKPKPRPQRAWKYAHCSGWAKKIALPKYKSGEWVSWEMPDMIGPMGVLP